MARKVILVSDLSGKEIPDDEQVEVRVLEFPDLSQPVRLDASKSETDRLKLEAKPFALLELITADGSVERIAVDVGELVRSVKGDITEVLANAEGLQLAPAPRQPEPEESRRRGRRPRGESAATSAGPKIDYTSVEYAGRVKRGIVSDGEKQTVREHFDEVNRNLEAAGQRTLDLSDIAIVERYGLQELAEERGISPKGITKIRP